MLGMRWTWRAGTMMAAERFYEVHLPDPVPAGPFRRVDGVLHGREPTEPKVLDFVGLGRRGILAEVRPTEAPQQGDDGPDPGHGADRVLAVRGGWVFRPAELGRGQTTHARAIDGRLIPNSSGLILATSLTN